MPLFSIVVPVYKAEKYIEKCVSSILSQTITDYELILVDDGSPDRSGKLCDKYSEKYSFIKTIHKKNGGLVSARKAGAAEMTGEYAICIDSDDWVEKKYLEKFHKIIKEYNPDIICSGMKRISAGSCKDMPMTQRCGWYSREQIESEIFPILIQGADGTTIRPNIAGKCIKKDLYIDAQMKVDDCIKISEDKAVIVPCIYKSNSLYMMKECGYYYRKNDESMTGKNVFSWNGPRLVSKHFQDRVDLLEFDFEKQIDRFIVHALFNVVVSQFNANKHYKDIVKEIKEHISEPYYRNAILNGRFRGYWPGILARFVLKSQMIWLAKIYYYKKIICKNI